MLSTISPAITPTSYVLDNACGPGIVTEQIKLQHSDVEIMAADHSEGMIDETKRRAEKEGWKNVQTELLDIRDLKSLPDETFTHAVMNLGLPVPGDPEGGVKAVREMFRILKPEGVAMMSTWAGKFFLKVFILPKDTSSSVSSSKLNYWNLTIHRSRLFTQIVSGPRPSSPLPPQSGLSLPRKI